MLAARTKGASKHIEHWFAMQHSEQPDAQMIKYNMSVLSQSVMCETRLCSDVLYLVDDLHATAPAPPSRLSSRLARYISSSSMVLVKALTSHLPYTKPM